MKAPVAAFRDNHAVAREVRSIASTLSTGVPPFVLLPYNYHEPEMAEWWLVPGPNPSIPAFRHSKLMIWTSEPGPEGEALFLGYYVEKGFDRTAAMPGTKVSHILRDDWYWTSFWPAALAGRLTPVIEAVEQRTRQPVVLFVGAGEFNSPPDDRERIRGDRVYLILEESGRGVRVERPGTNVLSSLGSCKSLDEVVGAIDRIDLRFYWIDVAIGVRCHYYQEAGPVWDASDIWRGTMEPWVSWLA